MSLDDLIRALIRLEDAVPVLDAATIAERIRAIRLDLIEYRDNHR